MNEPCFNHPDTKALGVCYNCKRSFCGSCLSEGKEFYFCFASECQDAFTRTDIPRRTIIPFKRAKLPAVVVCPICREELRLSRSERKANSFVCPRCNVRSERDETNPEKFTCVQLALPAQLICPNCNRELVLSKLEQCLKKFVCPYCGATCRLTGDTPGQFTILQKGDPIAFLNAPLPGRLNCPNCREELDLSEQERRYEEFVCPCCEVKCNRDNKSPDGFFIVNKENPAGKWGTARPGSLKRSTRLMNPAELAWLTQYKFDWYWGEEPAIDWHKERLALDIERGYVEVVHFEARRIWELHTCPPECCARTYVIELDQDTYVTLNTFWRLSLALFTDEMEQELPMKKKLEVALSPITRLLVSVGGDGEEVPLEREHFCNTKDGNPDLSVGSLFGWHCQLLTRGDLPELFKAALGASPSVAG